MTALLHSRDCQRRSLNNCVEILPYHIFILLNPLKVQDLSVTELVLPRQIQVIEN